MASSKDFSVEKRFIRTFTVRVASIRSVIDMMRYDNCWPATEEDSSKLAVISDEISDREKKGDWNLVRFQMAKRKPVGPTVERWESFGCKVIER